MFAGFAILIAACWQAVAVGEDPPRVSAVGDVPTFQAEERPLPSAAGKHADAGSLPSSPPSAGDPLEELPVVDGVGMATLDEEVGGCERCLSLFEDPDLGPPCQRLGWCGSLELGVLRPTLKGHLVAGAPIAAGQSEALQLPLGALDWTASPRVEVGYRWAEGSGEIRIGYRYLGSHGRARIPAFDAVDGGDQVSRLDVHSLDIDYVSSEFLAESTACHPPREFSARFGLRVAKVFFDSEAHGQQILGEWAGDDFAGVGPRMAFDFARRLGTSSVLIYGHLDAAGVLGQDRQHYSQRWVSSTGVVTSGEASTGATSLGVAVVDAEAGLMWEPGFACRGFRSTCGYQYENWWNLAQLADSRVQLVLQGIFLKGEFRY